MTNEQKVQIIALRKQGSSMAEVAGETGLPIGTVISFCRRNQISTTAEVIPQLERSPNLEDIVETKKPKAMCKCYGEPVSTLPHHKAKQFCSDKCRLAWWQENRHLAKGTSERICPACGATFSADTVRSMHCPSCQIPGMNMSSTGIRVCF